MKILLCFPQEDGETGLFVKNAFEKLGHTVTCVDAKKNPNDLLPTAIKVNPDFIFASRTPALLKDVQLIRKNYPHIKIVTWNVDKRNNVKEFGPVLIELFNNSHVFYTIAKGNIDDYKNVCPKTDVKFLQQGCDPEFHFPEKCPKKELSKYKCDVMFAGALAGHDKRKQLIDRIKKENINFKLFGRHTGNFITKTSHNWACDAAKIVLGHNAWPTIDISMSVRDYKVLAAGGFLLTEWCPGIEEWFGDEKICETYKTPDECIEKIKYYLEHEDERKEIAKRASEYIRKNHTYFHRMKQVVEEMNEILEKDIELKSNNKLLLGISEGIGNQVEALTFVNAAKEQYKDCKFDILYMEGSKFDFTKYLFENDEDIENVYRWDHDFPSDGYDGVIVSASTCKNKPNKVNCPDFSKFKINSHNQRMNTSEVTMNLLSVITPNDQGSFGLSKEQIERVFNFDNNLLRDEHKDAEEFDVVIHNGCNKRKDNLWDIKSYEKFDEITDILVQKGLSVACIGSKEEKINGCVNRSGLTFTESIGIINKCKVFISTDTGTYHIRAALKKPGIVLFTAMSQKKNWDKNFHKTIKKISHDPLCGHWPCQTESGQFWTNCNWDRGCKNIPVKKIIKEVEFLLSKEKDES